MSDNKAIAEQGSVATMEPSTILQVIQSAAINPDVDIEKMERLMAMHERLTDKQSEAIFHQAMTAAQSDVPPIHKDKTNKQTHSSYASYEGMDKVLRPIYVKHGFSLSFDTGSDPLEGCIRVLCYVSHSGGHSKTYQCDMPADGKGAKGGDVMTKTHAAGSGMSYGQRYLLKMIFNIAFSDDDGNAASGRNIAQELLDYNELVREHWDSITDCKRNLIAMHGELENQVNVTDARAALAEIPEDERKAIWRAPSKGGILTTRERALLKEKPEDAL